MTILQIVNTFFYLLIYPFVLGVVGLEAFGLYVFFSSIIAYFSVIINFGFDMHAAKVVSLGDNYEHSKILSLVTLGKSILFLSCVVLFLGLIYSFDIFKNNKELFVFCFINCVSSIFLHSWFFQGKQKMKYLTVIQLLFKVVSLPFMYVFLEKADDIYIYALIISLANVGSAIVSYLFIYYKFDVQLVSSSTREVFSLFVEVKHFFWSAAANAFKQKSIEIIIGALFGMKVLAIYDLANKIYSVPSLLVSNINAALFPKMVGLPVGLLAKRIIIIESLLAIVAIFSVVVFGYYVVDILSEDKLIDAYYVAIIMSFNIVTYLVVGACIYFIFIPKMMYDLVFRNQIVSFVSFYVICSLLLFFYESMYSVVLSMVLAGFAEILFCFYQIKKRKLLSQY
ncbi:oligosaccharide flippase family protein [Rheinheimera soli]|uniref:oligosaccharide flippase family protein n=1 Tax=Rheinheimera soli TaxID=443616 RepID=UPI001E57B61C|nr:oligosaccharide flippase family protein [Rheinheimera soli]